MGSTLKEIIVLEISGKLAMGFTRFGNVRHYAENGYGFKDQRGEKWIHNATCVVIIAVREKLLKFYSD